MIALYKFPGDKLIWGDRYRVKNFENSDLASALEDGWHESPQAAKLAYADRPPSRNELMQKAKELNLTVPHNISDAKLLKKVNDELDKTSDSV